MVFGALMESYGDVIFDNLNMSLLPMDHAYVKLTNLRDGPSLIYRVHKECIQCPYLYHFGYINNITRIINTKHETHYKVLTKHLPKLSPGSNKSVLCDVDTAFKEFGVYNLVIGKENCTVEVLKEPVNIYLPILTVFLIYSFLFVAVIILKLVIQHSRHLTKSNEINRKEPKDTTAILEKRRLKSLDTFRGIIITLMIFVNHGAGGYKCIAHVIWFGIHLADLLYPCFLWIMGLCIPLAMKSRIKKGDTLVKTLSYILKRTGILFLLGICLYSPLNLYKLRLTGVLQRLGICYLFHSSLCYIVMKRNRNYSGNMLGARYKDIAQLEFPWLVITIIVIIHTLVVFLVPFQDCPSGYFGPGGHHKDGKYFTCTAGITGHIDRILLGEHMFQNGHARRFYKSKKFDPEGLLGTLPALAHVCFGVQAGFTLLTFKKHKSRIKRWLIWGAVTGIMGGFLCNFSWNSGIIPICKHLWTISFMLVTCSFAFIAFALCYVVVDIKKIWDGKPFIYPGMNSIAMFVGHTMTKNQFPFNWFIEKYDVHLIKLLADISSTVLWILIAYFMYRKKIFLKI